jgi:Na+/H+ antiporter NhaC
MKANLSLGIIVFLLAVILLALVFANFNPPAASARTAASQIQLATAQAQDDSEIGSTDGILVMGVVIVLIVTLPLLFRRPR